MLTPDQIKKNREALSRGVIEKFAKDLGCDPNDPNVDVIGLLVDRTLAQAGILPREAIAELTAEQRAIVCAGMTEDEACANIVASAHDHAP